MKKKYENNYCKNCTVWKLNNENIEISTIIPLAGYQTVGISERNMSGEIVRFLYLKMSNTLVKLLKLRYSNETMLYIAEHNTKQLLNRVNINESVIITLYEKEEKMFKDCTLHVYYNDLEKTITHSNKKN